MDVRVWATDEFGGPIDRNRVSLSYVGPGPRPGSYCRVREYLFDQNGAKETAFITSLRTEQKMRYSAAHNSLDLLLDIERSAGEGAAASQVIRGNHAYLKVVPELFTTTVQYTGSGGKVVTWLPYRGPAKQRFIKGEWLVTSMENHLR